MQFAVCKCLDFGPVYNYIICDRVKTETELHIECISSGFL